jgi:hypothetical protein
MTACSDDEDQYVRTGVVYRLYDRNGSLIYIGSTGDTVAGRLVFHRYFSMFACAVAEGRETERMPLADARVAEKLAIATERPPLNMNHNPDYAGLSRVEKWAKYREALLALPLLKDIPAEHWQMAVDGHMADRVGATKRRREGGQADTSAALTPISLPQLTGLFTPKPSGIDSLTTPRARCTEADGMSDVDRRDQRMTRAAAHIGMSTTARAR